MTLDLLLIGVAIALNPLPLTSFFVLLPSRNGTVKGAAFVAGWLISLAVVVAVTVLATGNQPPRQSTAPSLAALAIKVAIGVVLVVVGVRRWRRLPQPKPPKKTPRWQAGVDEMSPWFALGLAALVQPWGLVAAGAATIVQAKVSSLQSALALIFFCLLASAPMLTLELLAVFRPRRSHAIIGRVRAWMGAHTDAVVITGCLALGVWLIAHDIYLIAVAS